MRQLLISSLKLRISTELAPQNPLIYLQEFEVEDYIDSLISIAYLHTRSKKGSTKNTIFLSEIISAIGHSIRGKYKLRRDSASAARTGAFMLYSFEYLEMLKVTLGKSSGKHAAYIVQVLNDDAICELWETVKLDSVEKLPSLEPYAPWTSVHHPSGNSMIKTYSRDVLEMVRPDTHPILFECINRSQAMGWNVNEDVFKIYNWALRNKTEAFSDIWDSQNPEAKATKLREAKAIGNIAKRFVGKTFYHRYYYDFRGRRYPATAYFHEQGTDLAKGLLLRADKKPIGEEGFFWLLVSIASNWAGSSGREDGAKTDKIPLRDRYEWALDNEDILLDYAVQPKVNQGWMKADKAWQFFAACNELKKLRVWQGKYGYHLDPYNDFSYPSSLECFIDGL
jgi:hypothetical protein